jgi:hypothetical protein
MTNIALHLHLEALANILTALLRPLSNDGDLKDRVKNSVLPETVYMREVVSPLFADGLFLNNEQHTISYLISSSSAGDVKFASRSLTSYQSSA